ncbi:hypothetical protein NC651_016966 [Populus alba x Populus x berolinensis]|nr:hypothetical protein NC651_016966 [Populus alba x Populus x berolinensis]
MATIQIILAQAHRKNVQTAKLNHKPYRTTTTAKITRPHPPSRVKHRARPEHHAWLDVPPIKDYKMETCPRGEKTLQVISGQVSKY